MTMSTRYSTSNPLDRIFLGIASLVIVSADAAAFYHCVVTSLDPPSYAATAVGIFPPLQDALPTASSIDRHKQPIPIADPFRSFVSAVPLPNGRRAFPSYGQ